MYHFSLFPKEGEEKKKKKKWNDEISVTILVRVSSKVSTGKSLKLLGVSGWINLETLSVSREIGYPDDEHQLLWGVPLLPASGYVLHDWNILLYQMTSFWLEFNCHGQICCERFSVRFFKGLHYENCRWALSRINSSTHLDWSKRILAKNRWRSDCLGNYKSCDSASVPYCESPICKCVHSIPM